MFSLQRLLGKDDVFLDLLEQCSTEALNSVQKVAAILKGTAEAGLLNEFLSAGRRERRLLEEIEEHLVTTFVTGLDREDIEAVSRALFRVVKTTEKLAKRYRLVSDLVVGVDFSKQARFIEESMGVVVDMIRELRRSPSLERMKALNDRVDGIEDSADDVSDGLVRDLYHQNLPSGQFLARKDLYDLLEKLVDRCRDVGAVVNHIVLKNS